MSDVRQLAIAYIEKNKDRFLTDLKDFLRIPSISAEEKPDDPEIKQAAEWLAGHLTGLGIEHVQVLPTANAPVVYGDWLKAGKEAPTVLVYGHYDVQPVDPLDLWITPPFEPTLRGENLFARGASDMKGQIMASLNVIEAIMKTGQMPVNLKFLIEGEEEIGSPSMDAFLHGSQELFTSDVALNIDAGMIGKEEPTITYALRGLVYFEIWIVGPDHDLHSGLYGGVVHNPAQALCELIAGMHDQEGRVTLPGFYDPVRKLSDEERADQARLPMDEAFYLEQTGVPNLWGEPDFIPAERIGSRPTLEVNGLLSGWTEPGTKTVLPGKAMAKISCRLVADQKPADVHKQLIQYMEENAPDTIHWEVKLLQKNPPAIAELDNPGVVALGKALETVWGVRPYYRREGGSIPVVESLQRMLGVESALSGFSLPEDNLHAPNEKLHLPTWFRGMEALVHFFYNMR
ncbi:MAG: dipeptidase [Anaerolineales bacterium]|nr:dipeptidase [Anaerolineales bacterium]